MESQNLKQRTIKGIITQILVNFSLNGLAMVKTFIFARIFAPDDFGIFATAGLVISFVVLFGEMGISQSIIREKGDARKLMDTAFTMNILVGFMFFVIIFIIAPVAADIFGNPGLTLYIQFLSYSAFGAALALPNVMFDREMRFGISKLPQFFSLAATFVVTLAAVKLYDVGTWSLFFGGLAGFISNAATVWVIASYKPRPRFDMTDARRLFSFGWPLFFSSILGYIVWQGDDLMVRYFWGDTELGYYTVAFYMPMYLTQIVDMVSAVLFPAFSKMQDSKEKLELAFNMSNKYLAIICVPIGMGMAVFAPQIIHYLYSDKWAPAIPVLQIFALTFALRCSFGHNWSLPSIARGNTKIVMWAQTGNALITLTIGTYLIYKLGIFGGAILGVINLVIWSFPLRAYGIKRELGTLKFLNEVWKPTLSGVLSVVIMLWLNVNIINIYWFLAMGLLFICTYLFILFILDRKMIYDIKELYKFQYRGGL